MKKSEVLRRAKECLWDGRNEINLAFDDKEKYICHAIETAFQWPIRGEPYKDLVKKTKQWVVDYLKLNAYPGGSQRYALEDVVSKQNLRFSTYDCIAMQAYRHQKLDEMIAYLEERGE
jgi:hypothetical protein